jgi:hypothetical protein
LDIYIKSDIGGCQEFMSADANRKTEEVSIVISPLKITTHEDGTIRVISGCNMWQGCHNARCHFSMAARKAPKIKKAGD